MTAPMTDDDHDLRPRWETTLSVISVASYFIAALFMYGFSLWLHQMYTVGGSFQQAWSMAVSLGWEVVAFTLICLLGGFGFCLVGVGVGRQRKATLRCGLLLLCIGAMTWAVTIAKGL